MSWTLEPDPGDAGVGTEHGAFPTPRFLLGIALILAIFAGVDAMYLARPHPAAIARPRRDAS
ncbi:hypothetical protein CHELA1G11_12133 [Hyphomicrobiales bacterium]|nr:hypothetical protein CHELA1G11_12133 [Hyphomicrobiales bacterium]